MSNPFDPQINPIKISPFWGFVVFDNISKFPIYSQYNFNFQKYFDDFKPELDDSIIGNTKNKIFWDFWQRNGNNFALPYTIKPELTQYFNTITLDTINYIYKYSFNARYQSMSYTLQNGALGAFQLIDEQFTQIDYTDSEVARVQDFYYEDEFGTYTKYNFLFDKFSEDFQIYGPKRLIFTHFITRNAITSGCIMYTLAYGINPDFRKYFDLSNKNELIQYLIDYSICTALDSTFRNVNNVNWNAYVVDNNLNIPVALAPEEWYQEGQFDRRIMKVFSPKLNEVDFLKNSICVVYGDNVGTGFRPKVKNAGADSVYVATVLSLFPNPNTRLFLATFQIIDDNNVAINVTAQFRLIGKDSLSNLALGKFDPELPFNIANNVTDISYIPAINFDTAINQANNGDKIIMYGNINGIGNIVLLSGTIINPNYTGTFDFNYNDANYILSEINTDIGMEGGPQFVFDKKSNTYKCVSMTIKNLFGNNNIAVGIDISIVSDFSTNSALVWDSLIFFYGYNYDILDLLIDSSVSRIWLGVSGNYFNYAEINKYNKLTNLNYTGGYVVYNVIEGFNRATQEFVFNTFELNNNNVIRLFSPFSESKIHKIIYDSNAPVVITKLAFIDGTSGNYTEYIIGKYQGQVSLFNLFYGFINDGQYLSDDPEEFGGALETFSKIKVTFLYYNGNTWEEDVEYIGGDGPFWQVKYTNPSGKTLKLNRFYLPPYIILYLSDIYNRLFETDIRRKYIK
jgi:hypothetical protein